MSKNTFLDRLKGLASDVKYFERMIDAESAAFKADLAAKIKNSPDPYQHLEVVSNHLIDILAQMSARIKLLEAGLAKEQHIAAANVSITGLSPMHTMKLAEETSISAEQFGSHPNFYGPEKTDTGVFYTWTGPSPVNTFEIPVSREKEKFSQLRFISIIDEELLSSLTIKVDGEAVKFKQGSSDNLRVLEFKLPASRTQKATVLSICLAKTISPLETGKGQDARHLGMAISGITVTRKSVI